MSSITHPIFLHIFLFALSLKPTAISIKVFSDRSLIAFITSFLMTLSPPVPLFMRSKYFLSGSMVKVNKSLLPSKQAWLYELLVSSRGRHSSQNVA